MTNVAPTRAASPRSRIRYCQKHASARFRPPVPADPHRDWRFCTSEPVDYDPSATPASDGSIGRYYDPVTGQFLSVDPDLAQTGEPYAYAGDDPVNETDPTGDLSLGICAGFETHIVFVQLGAGDCLVEILNGSNKGEIGVTGTALAGLGLGLQFGLKFYVQVSNADSLDQLSSWFTYFGATAGFGPGVEGAVFWNDHLSGPIIVGGDVGVELEAGASVALGESYTWVKVIDGWFGLPADAARGAFDILKHLGLPSGFDAQSVLNKAEVAADTHLGPNGSGCRT
jgi:RHS repeat-associated protein